MDDSQKLLRALLDYQRSLRSHLDTLKSDYQKLEERWEAFNEESEGKYADQFRAGWRKTDARFQYYINYSQKIYDFLEEKTKNLQDLNQEESFSLWKTLDKGIIVLQGVTGLLAGVVAGPIPDGRLLGMQNQDDIVLAAGEASSPANRENIKRRDEELDISTQVANEPKISDPPDT